MTPTISRRALLGYAAALPLVAGCASARIPPSKLSRAEALARMGATSVCFREWFVQTRGMLKQIPEAELPDRRMTLLEFPAFLKQEFGLANAEVWNLHFDDTSLDYCRALAAAAKAAGSRISNVQVDLSDVDLAAPDAEARKAAIETTKGWMDRAVACGAPRMRSNTNVPVEGRAFDVPLIADSFRQLAEHGRRIGVTILVENHWGSARIADAVAVVKTTNDPWCRSLLDWGNTPGTDTASRIADYSAMFPYLALVSAKGLHFDARYRHVEYDIAMITRAVEASGYTGLYSVELYADEDPPRDPVRAVKAMIDAIAPELVNRATAG